MSFQIQSFNIWAVLVSFVIHMVIGALWYSPILFGNIWLKEVGKKSEGISNKDAWISMALSMIPAIVSVLLIAITISLTKASTVIDALIIGSIISVGFIGMSILTLILFENRKYLLTLINVGYFFVSFNIVSVILTLWKQ